MLPSSLDGSLVARSPLVVPVVVESWQYPNTFPMIWARIVQHLGPAVESYARRKNCRYGPHRVRVAFNALSRERLIVQHVIRYHPLLAGMVEFFVGVAGTREDLRSFLDCVRAHVRSVESYPTKNGYLCRMQAATSLLAALFFLPAAYQGKVGVYLQSAQHYPYPVRFRYETLFDPLTGTWREVT